MKKLISLSILLLSFLAVSYSQSVNGIPLDKIETEYIQIVGTSKFLSNKVNIQLDFGQHDKMFSAKDTQVRDENNKQVTLNSMIDALNFMTKYGYEFVQAYAFSVGNQNVYHYLLRKKK